MTNQRHYAEKEIKELTFCLFQVSELIDKDPIANYLLHFLIQHSNPRNGFTIEPDLVKAALVLNVSLTRVGEKIEFLKKEGWLIIDKTLRVDAIKIEVAVHQEWWALILYENAQFRNHDWESTDGRFKTYIDFLNTSSRATM